MPDEPTPDITKINRHRHRLERGLLAVVSTLGSRRAEQRRQHLLQSAHQEIGFLVTFEQRFDLPVFGLDLIVQERTILGCAFDFPFKHRDIARRVGRIGRVLSRRWRKFGGRLSLTVAD